MESRVIAIRDARVHENWGRVLRVTRETPNARGWFCVFALELDNHVEGGPSLADCDLDYRDHNQPITGTVQ